jgi:hypothetical protein
MKHYLAALLLPALLVLGSVAPANAQWIPPRVPYSERTPWMGQSLAGNYINTSNGQPCQIQRQGRGYLFVNENGTPAQFVFVSPNRLEMVSGDWNPDTVATVGRDRDGRMLLRFQEPGKKPGFWVRTD